MARAQYADLFMKHLKRMDIRLDCIPHLFLKFSTRELSLTDSIFLMKI